MTARFAPETLARLGSEREVTIETRASEIEPAHRTVIWVVVDDQDRVLIRSWRGATARWYREALEHAEVRLHIGEEVVAARALPAADRERIEACSDGFRRKYADSSSTPAMVAPEVLGTTLELVPA